MPEHRRADDLGRRIRPGSDAVVLDQPPVEGGDLLERDPDLLARADPRRGAVHLVSARDHPLDERARLAHALDRLGRELHGLRFARDAHDVCDGQPATPEDDRHADQTSSAARTSVSQLRALVLDRQGVAEDRRGEAALRRDRQPLERHEGRRFPNAPDELVHGLPPAALRRHEPEDDDLVLRHLGERLERARALVVVFEQDPLGLHPGEQACGDPVVAAGDEPAARLVPAAEVHPERHARMVADDEVVELEAELQPAVGGPAAGLVELPVAGVEEEGVVRRVELDVAGAEAHELVDLLAEDLGDVSEVVLEGRVGLGRAIRIPEVGE